jgi:hypothetical protein
MKKDLQKRISYLGELDKLLSIYRHYGFETRELLGYIIRRLGFKVVISKKRKLIRLKNAWE